MGGGGGGGTTTVDESTRQDTTVTVTNNITGPPISVNVGSEVLSPIARTFQPAVESVQASFASLQSGFVNAENRRSQQEDLTAAALLKNQEMQQLIVYALIGMAVVQLLPRLQAR